MWISAHGQLRAMSRNTAMSCDTARLREQFLSLHDGQTMPIVLIRGHK